MPWVFVVFLFHPVLTCQLLFISPSSFLSWSFHVTTSICILTVPRLCASWLDSYSLTLRSNACVSSTVIFAYDRTGVLKFRYWPWVVELTNSSPGPNPSEPMLLTSLCQDQARVTPLVFCFLIKLVSTCTPLYVFWWHWEVKVISVTSQHFFFFFCNHRRHDSREWNSHQCITSQTSTLSVWRLLLSLGQSAS